MIDYKHELTKVVICNLLAVVNSSEFDIELRQHIKASLVETFDEIERLIIKYEQVTSRNPRGFNPGG